MSATQTNPKALNKTILFEANSKVTLGFKCSPATKLELIKLAENTGISLSEFVENLVNNSLAGKQFSSPDISEQTIEIERLKKRISYYESPKVIELFNKLKGREIEFINEDGIEDYILVQSLKDVYVLLFASLSTMPS